MNAADRVPTGYFPAWDTNLKRGAQAELFVNNILEQLADGSLKHETKIDDKFIETGNLYVEFEQQSLKTGEWKLSGISTTKADVWFFVINERKGLIVVDAEWLKRAARRALRTKPKGKARRPGDIPTNAALVTINDLIATAKA